MAVTLSYAGVTADAAAGAVPDAHTVPPEAVSAVPRNAATTADVRAMVTERLAEALDERHISDDVLQVMLDKERRSLGRFFDAEAFFVIQESGAVRNHMLWLIGNMLTLLKNSGAWFEAARILDTAGKGLLRAVADDPHNPNWKLASPEVMYTNAAAFCRVAEALNGQSLQNDDCCTPIIKLASLANYASHASISVGGQPVHLKAIWQTERAILPDLDSAPNVVTWIEIFCARFDVVTMEVFSHKLPELTELVEHLAMCVVLRFCISAALPPRTIAVGCFAVALAALRAVPSVVLCPEGVDVSEWEALISQLNPRNHMPIAPQERQAPLLPAAVAIGVLEFAMLQDAAAVRSQAFTAARMVSTPPSAAAVVTAAPAAAAAAAAGELAASHPRMESI